MDKNNRTRGFKGMLRDRMFPHTDIALQICKCKGKYIDYIYDRFIRNKPVELRSITVKQVLGLKAAVTYDDIQLWAWRHGKIISRKKLQQVPVEMRFFQFVDTIGWQELYQDDIYLYRVFQIANTWDVWLRRNLPYLWNIWKVNKKQLQYSDEQIRKEFIERFKLDEESAKFIIKYFSNGKYK